MQCDAYTTDHPNFISVKDGQVVQFPRGNMVIELKRDGDKAIVFTEANSDDYYAIVPVSELVSTGNYVNLRDDFVAKIIGKAT